MKPQARKAVVSYTQSSYTVSERRACRLFRLSRSVSRYKLKRSDDPEIILKIKDIAERRRRFGYRRIFTLLKREGIKMNQKKFRRIYFEQKLSLKIRKGRKIRSMPRSPIEVPVKSNQRWSMDFVRFSINDRGSQGIC